MNCFRLALLALFVCLFPAISQAEDDKRILILGDSLTKGEGLNPDEAFPALLQTTLEKEGLTNWTVLNGGVSGDTTAGGLRRLNWLIRRKVDILVVALGGNDGLRGIDPAETDRNLQAIVDKALKANPEIKILLAGMQMPDNFGQDYVSKFREVFPTVAKRNELPIIPFLLEGVGGVEELNLPDQIHPNQAGQKIIAKTVWQALKPMVSGSGE